MSTPATTPDHDTTPSAKAVAAKAAFTNSAGANRLMAPGSITPTMAWSTRLSTHSVAAAANGTDRLSSRRTGIDSTRAATAAARTGAPTTNVIGAGEIIARCVHQQSSTLAGAPARKKPIVPAHVFSGFQGRRAPSMDCPHNVATPSPTARIAHAA